MVRTENERSSPKLSAPYWQNKLHFLFYLLVSGESGCLALAWNAPILLELQSRMRVENQTFWMKGNNTKSSVTFRVQVWEQQALAQKTAWWLIVKWSAWGQYLMSRCERLVSCINFARIVATPAALNSFELQGFDQSKETVGVLKVTSWHLNPFCPPPRPLLDKTDHAVIF